MGSRAAIAVVALLVMGILTAPGSAQDDVPIRVTGTTAQESNWACHHVVFSFGDEVLFDIEVDLANPAALEWSMVTDPQTGVLGGSDPFDFGADGPWEGTIEHQGGPASHRVSVYPSFDLRYEPLQTVTFTLTVPDQPELGSFEANARVIDNDWWGIERSEYESVQEEALAHSDGYLADVLVSSEVFADGLAAAFLGEALDLTDPDALDPDVHERPRHHRGRARRGQ